MCKVTLVTGWRVAGVIEGCFTHTEYEFGKKGKKTFSDYNYNNNNSPMCLNIASYVYVVRYFALKARHKQASIEGSNYLPPFPPLIFKP